ncbi:MAG: hypothetical protein KAQ89_05480 [Planctomycetes bacterium]|nr:hypothetical protein [Planctomycetota bacterium]
MNIIEHAKEVADLIKKYNDQYLYERIVTLREEILEIREENIQLKQEVKAMKETQDIGSKLIRKGNRYFFKDDVEEDRPYCLTCWDYDRKLVSLILTKDRFGTRIKCGVCAARK